MSDEVGDGEHQEDHQETNGTPDPKILGINITTKIQPHAALWSQENKESLFNHMTFTWKVALDMTSTTRTRTISIILRMPCREQNLNLKQDKSDPIIFL